MKKYLFIATLLLAVIFTANNTSVDASHKQPIEQKVCFKAHNLADPIDVTGSFYAPKKGYDQNTPVLLMLHGFSTNRSLWNGFVAGPDLAGSMVQEMTSRGYVVIAIDRPAYGDSPYKVPLSGYKVNGYNQIDMMHEIVTQIKAGSYNQTDAGCPSTKKVAVGSKRVVMVGHSFSGALVTGYGSKYDDIEGIIAWGFSNQGSNPELIAQSTQNFAPTNLSLHGYGNFYADGPSGISDQCKKSYYIPGMNLSVLNIVCANDNLLPTPVGEVSSSPALSASNNAGIAAKTIGSIKVLITFGEHDNDFPRSGPTGNLQQAEIDYWNSNCACDVSSYIQPNTGHNGMLHLSMPETAEAFDNWLNDKGLGGDK